jgi:hypothetical protein
VLAFYFSGLGVVIVREGWFSALPFVALLTAAFAAIGIGSRFGNREARGG